ncbi:zinc finger, C4 type [Necator americanus]|uniref:Zinc finger, C4 type n=1 Tax=Necator americanus TaxID=51031 RepID=W2U1M0_NECAM|nr:zinc finger, C4 type [Necator americanus]ETN87251.1 zinc finger, C4 type [Necator americanus]
MSSSCAVCEMPSSGLHFGVSCCRACAAFFRRTLSLKLKYKCRFSGMCEVTQKKRYSCRHCRFQKCVKVGMRKEMVQMGNVQNTIDPYETTKPSSSNPGSIASYSSCSPPEPAYRIPAIVRNDSYQQTNQINAYDSPTNLDVYTNAQMILKAKIDALFDREFNLNSFPYAIPLSVCQQAMIAYTNHSQHWQQCKPGRVCSNFFFEVL